MSNLPDKALQATIQSMLSQKKLIQSDKESPVYLHQNSFDLLKKEVLSYLDRYHKANPLKAGMPKEELKSRLPLSVSSKLFNMLIIRMGKEGDAVAEGENIRLLSHTVSLATDQEDIRGKIVDAYKKGGLTPPYFKEISQSFDLKESEAKKILMFLVGEGKIIKVKEDLYFDAETIEALKTELVRFLTENSDISAPQFKDMTGVSRKYLIPLFEYFDSKNITIRVGDVRKLRSR
jgi:selenocysteine-specific elongation factor